MARSLILTEAGADLFIDDSQGGSAAVTIDAVKLGDAAYAPSASQTAMQGSVVRTITPTAGGSPDDNVIHLAIQDDDPGYAYSAYEIGVFSGDVLVAIYSVGAGQDPVIVKTADSTVWLTIDIVLTPGATRDVTIEGDITLDVNQASTTKKGTVYLATAAEAAAGASALKAITPATLKAETDKLVTLGTAQNITQKKTFSVSPSVPTPPALASLTSADDPKVVNVAWIKALLLALHPVGSYYLTEGGENPGTLFGGTWTKVQNAFLYGSGTYAAGKPGGAASVTLSTGNLPAHSHTVTAADGGAHAHSVKIAKNGLTLSAASAGAHAHNVKIGKNVLTLSAASAGAHTHTASVSVPATACSCTNENKHSHTRGTMEIKGVIPTGARWKHDNYSEWLDHATAAQRSSWQAFCAGGAVLYLCHGEQDGDTSGDGGAIFSFAASRSWTGETSSIAAHKHTVSFPKTTASGTAASGGAHTHTVTGPTADTTLSGAALSGGAHGHTVTGPAADTTLSSAALSAGTHKHTMTCGNTGSGQSFSILPTFRAVHIWRRTA